MPRKTSEINKKIGNRIKELLSDLNMTQKEFAAEFHYTEQHISYIVRGTRNLTVEMAQEIAKRYPIIRFEWLLGYDDYKTEHDRFAASVGALHDSYNHVTALISLHGYSFSEIDLSSADAFIKQAYSANAVEVRNNSGQARLIPHSQWRRIISEIDRFVEFELSGLFSKGT